jgi:hypothetical protein
MARLTTPFLKEVSLHQDSWQKPTTIGLPMHKAQV